MDFEEFMPKEEIEDSDSLIPDLFGKKPPIADKISQDQFYDIITGNELSWQSIIYELIHTEQLDPWNIDLAILAQRYLEKIQQLEEDDFFVSSKVLLAASLLLRIKSEILLNQYIRSLDEILFGKKEEKKYEVQRMEIDENELPELVPRTPMPRFRQVTLQELMTALNKAINTESRRIKREISIKQAERLTEIVIPKTRVNVRDRIRQIYAKIQVYFKKKPTSKLGFTELIGDNREEKLAAFLPILHLDNQQKIWLSQEKHFDEIWIWLFDIIKKKEEAFAEIEKEIEEVKQELELDSEQKERLELINKDFENPLAEFFELNEN